jgi:hypothetical protein
VNRKTQDLKKTRDSFLPVDGEGQTVDGGKRRKRSLINCNFLNFRLQPNSLQPKQPVRDSLLFITTVYLPPATVQLFALKALRRSRIK